jgi:hydrogenase maturation factor
MVDAGLVLDPRPGDLVLVHGGCVVSRVEGAAV